MRSRIVGCAQSPHPFDSTEGYQGQKPAYKPILPKPQPTAVPNAAATQIDAAAVNPFIFGILD